MQQVEKNNIKAHKLISCWWNYKNIRSFSFHSGSRGYFRNECCTGGESVAALRANRLLTPIHQRQAQGCTTRKYIFSSLR